MPNVYKCLLGKPNTAETPPLPPQKKEVTLESEEKPDQTSLGSNRGTSRTVEILRVRPPQTGPLPTPAEPGPSGLGVPEVVDRLSAFHLDAPTPPPNAPNDDRTRRKTTHGLAGPWVSVARVRWGGGTGGAVIGWKERDAKVGAMPSPRCVRCVRSV